MQGDFSLNPLAYRAGVSRVLFQQGRVQLDSDANEQVESLLRFSRGLAIDLIGAHGGVADAFDLTGFTAGRPDFLIGWGVYYVDGIRCVNYPADFDVYTAAVLGQPAEAGLAYKDQPDYFAPDQGDWTKSADGKDVLFYLDVFERHVSATEDARLREVALLGPDTASRAVVVWQVRAMPAAEFAKRLATLGASPVKLPATWDLPYLALNLVLRTNVRMRARAIVTEATDPCTISPDARYRGPDNRLFRVEIHDGGSSPAKPTFKWSADNGSTVYPIRLIEGTTVHLDSLGRDDRTAIRVNDWVEVVDDRVSLTGKANPLLQVVDVRPHDMTVTLSEEPADKVGRDETLHPVLRRWSTAPVPIREGKNERDGWFELADGVEVQFSQAAATDGAPSAAYRTGDYWLVPARTATGDVSWPHDNNHPRAVPPHGVEHHYAPLATVDPNTGTATHLRRAFEPMATPVP
jgi:hypothetical protein